MSEEVGGASLPIDIGLVRRNRGESRFPCGGEDDGGAKNGRPDRPTAVRWLRRGCLGPNLQHVIILGGAPS
jgi:hypothetical protein